MSDWPPGWAEASVPDDESGVASVMLFGLLLQAANRLAIAAINEKR